MNWIEIAKETPDPNCDDQLWITDGYAIGWCFYGEDENEDLAFFGGDCCGRLYKDATHWMKIELPKKSSQ